MKYVELCAGLGGSRTGFDSLGWECALAVEKDIDTANLHRDIHGDCLTLDVCDINPTELPSHDVLISGFPCQPFSTSGSQTGFHHPSGNVFDAISRILEENMPSFVILENVAGLLSNRYGHSMGTILKRLCDLGYFVEWLLTDSVWLGVPQTRPRIFLIARLRPQNMDEFKDLLGDNDFHGYFQQSSIFAPLLREISAKLKPFSNGELSSVVRDIQPRIGEKMPTSPTPFGPAGVASQDHFASLKRVVKTIIPSNLGEICCPNFPDNAMARSVRYYARGAGTKPTFRDKAVAHCVGTNIGAAPTFAIPLEYIRGDCSKRMALEWANWTRIQDGHLIFRLVPERAVHLFGSGVERIAEALKQSQLGITKKYVMLGDMVAPMMASRIGSLIETSTNA